LQGLAPSPQVKYKFQSQAADPVNGNDLCHEVFGKNAKKRHKHFKAFFAVQDPHKAVPNKMTHPNFKVDPFLSWIQSVSMEAWEMGEKLFCDEQTMGFKGMHKDKHQFTYKAEGNGFLCTAFCQDGYTYSFYFCNQPPPVHYISQGFSPLHSWVLFMFDQLNTSNTLLG